MSKKEEIIAYIGLAVFSVAIISISILGVYTDQKRMFCSDNFQRGEVVYYKCEEMYDDWYDKSTIIEKLKEG